MERLKYSARFIIAIIGFCGVFLAPPYIPLLCIVLLALRFRASEAIAIGFLMDLVWLPSVSLHALPLCTLSAIAIVWLLEPLRVQLLR